MSMGAGKKVPLGRGRATVGEEDRRRGVTGGREEKAVEEDSMDEWVWWR